MSDALFLMKTIADLTSKVGSGITPKGGSNIYTRNGPKLIRSQNVHPGCLSLADAVCIPEEIHQSMNATRVEGGDVLLNITGASIGRCAIAPFDIGEANVNQHVCIIRSEPGEIDSSFLMHYLNSYGGQDQINRFQAGGNREGLNFAQIRSMEIPIPPHPEQKKIAEILSGIDHVIASNQNRIRSSQLLKKALISRHIESIEHEVDEAKLGDLVNSVDSGWSPDCLKRPPLSDSEWSVLKTTSVTWTGFDQQERKALPINLSPKEELVVEAGDILITRAGPADRTGVVAYADKKAVNTMISDKIIRLRCDTSTIEPRFLSIFLGTDYAQRQMLKGKVGMASSQTNISQQLLREMEIRFPPLPEQRRISEIIAELQKTINQFQKYIDHTEKLKVSLSSDLLSGRKRVSI